MFLYAAVAGIYAILTDGVIRDDAYIFFTYARNLADHSALAFNTGETSYGVTSIAWSFLITVGTFVGGNPIVVSKVLGILLGATGTWFWSLALCPRSESRLAIAAVAAAALVPNIGADRMVTGMETSLLCLLSGALVISLQSERLRPHYVAGVLLGLLILTRPEMVLALPLVVGYLWLRRSRASALAVGATGIVVSAWWYLWLWHTTGSFLPPTRIGKLSVFLPENLGPTIDQFFSQSSFERALSGMTAFARFAFSGISELSFVVLLSASLISAFVIWTRMTRARGVLLSLPSLFGLVLVAVYCWSFPLFQLRYFEWLVPALCVSLVASFHALLPRKLSLIAGAAFLVACLAAQPFALARRIDSTRVQQIRRQVGETIKQTTPAGARIALEPIGEIGYYADRYIVDMGGITNPSIQPYIRGGYQDVESIRKCLVAQKADYLVTYDHDGFLGRLPKAYPDMFETAVYIPAERVRDTRYRLLKIRKDAP